MVSCKQSLLLVLVICNIVVIISATTCQFPGDLQHASHKIHRRGHSSHQGHLYSEGDTIIYTCNHGYIFDTYDEYEELVCQSDGSWDIDFQSLFCEELECYNPGTPTNGQIIGPLKKIYKIGEEVQFSCDNGFILSGPEVLKCSQDHLDWNGFKPECYRPRCPLPRHPDHGRRIGNQFYEGDSVRFVCHSSYQLVGSATRTCKHNGQWSGARPTCEQGITYCEDPGVPDGGYKKGHHYFQGAKVEYHCKRGFFLLGSRTRICLSNGLWSGEEAKCENKYTFDDTVEVAPELNKEVDRLALETTSSQGHQRRRKRSLQALKKSPGGLDLYFVFDGSGSISKESFAKGKKLAEAIIQKLGVSHEEDVGGTRIGALVYSDKPKIAFQAADPFNTPEEVIHEIKAIKHIEKSTFSSEALKTVRTNMIPFTRQAMSHRYNSKIAILVITDGKHNVGGDPAEEAKKLQVKKKDGGHEAEIFCVGVTPDSDLKVKLADMASKPTRKHVFRFDHYESVEFLADELIQNQPDYNECGIAGDNTNLNEKEKIVGGQNAARDAWPWMAALYFGVNCETDLSDMVEKFTHGCGGSLIHPEWILTAAHCFQDGKPQFPQNVYVKLGSTKQQPYKSDGEQLEQVDTVYIHPNYIQPGGSTSTTYLNDIALVHLQQPVYLDSSVRTVCLPGDVQGIENGTKLYKHGTHGVVTGWGHTEPRQSNEPDEHIVSNEDLKQTQLRYRSTSKCVATVLERNITNYEKKTAFCAGFPGLGQDDVCKGDSGGPFVVLRKNNVRAERFVQTGITSWNFGCAQENLYSFFTRVDQYVPWIKEVQRDHAAGTAKGEITGCGQ